MRHAAMILLILLVLPFTALAAPETLEHDFEQGNQFYADGRYEQAAAEYEKIVRAGYESSDLYYNLGNASFRQGKLGHAIMNYIRARRLDPRDDDIRANLEFARGFTIDKIEVTQETILLDYVNRFFDSFSLSEIAWLTALLYLLTVGAILAGLIYHWLQVPRPLIIVLFILFLLSAGFTGVKLDRDVLTRTGVVITQQVEVKNGPGEDFTSQFTAHAGLLFTIERKEAGYFLVNFENRLKGWIAASAVAEI